MADKFQNKYRIASARLQNWDYHRSGSYFITICTKSREHFFGKIENRKMILNNIGDIVHHEWMITPKIRTDMNLLSGEFVVMPNHFHGILIIGDNKYNNDANHGDAMHGDAMHGDAMHGDENRGDANRGDANRGDANRGDANRGDANRGDANHGGVNCGDANGGDANCGDANHGGVNCGDANRGDAMHGDANRGDANRGGVNCGDAFVETQCIASLPPASRNDGTAANQFGPQRKNVSSIIRGFKSAVTKNARMTCPDFGWQPRFHDHVIRNQKSFENISNYIKNNPFNWNADKFYDRY